MVQHRIAEKVVTALNLGQRLCQYSFSYSVLASGEVGPQPLLPFQGSFPGTKSGDCLWALGDGLGGVGTEIPQRSLEAETLVEVWGRSSQKLSTILIKRVDNLAAAFAW